MGAADEVPDEPQTVVLFSPRFMRMLSAASRSLRVWEARTGKLISTMRDCTATHIVQICLDHTERCCFTGEHSGDVCMFNLAAGQLARRMTKHDGEIIALALLKDWGSGGKGLGGEVEKHGSLLVSACNALILVSSVCEGTCLFRLSVTPGVGPPGAANSGGGGGGNAPEPPKPFGKPATQAPRPNSLGQSMGELSALCTSVNSLALLCAGTGNGGFQVWKVWDVRTARLHSGCRPGGAEISA
eukprot:1239582-Prymnesium_polylepis.1